MTHRQEVPFVDLGALHVPLEDELRAAFERVLASSAFTSGVEVAAFETAFAAKVATTHAVGVNSGTAALHLLLLAAGIGTGDEVILPPNTFFATAEAVVAAGATPVLADVDPQTALLDPAAVENAITSRTAAIIVVHLYGQPGPVDELAAIAGRHGLLLLEDAAQAIGGSWAGRPVGSLGHAAAFSFYPGKNLGALGEGGAVTTSDPDLARRVRELRSHGEAEKHVHVHMGFNERLDELQAAFLNVKLAKLDEAQRLRDIAAARYHDHLATVSDVVTLETAAAARHVHHLLVVRVPERDGVLQRMRAAGVAAAVHYPVPIHEQPAGRHLGRRGQFPSAEALADSVVSLPLYPGISEGQIRYCVEVTAQALRRVA